MPTISLGNELEERIPRIKLPDPQVGSSTRPHFSPIGPRRRITAATNPGGVWKSPHSTLMCPIHAMRNRQTHPSNQPLYPILLAGKPYRSPILQPPLKRI